MSITVEQAEALLEQIPLEIVAAGTQQALSRWVDQAVGELGQAMIDGTAPGGGSHAPLRHPRPHGHNQSSTPLIDFGDMMRSLISDGGNHIERYESGSVVLGTADEKAAFHQWGTSNTPARPFVGFTENMVDLAEQIVADEIMSRLESL